MSRATGHIPSLAASCSRPQIAQLARPALKPLAYQRGQHGPSRFSPDYWNHRRTFSSTSKRHADPPSRYSKFDTSMKSDVRDSSIDPSAPTVLSNIVDSSEDLLTISSFSENGIQLSDGTATRSGVMIVNGQVFLWDVHAPEVKPGVGIEGLWKDWTEDRFALLEALTPRPEILLFGTGNRPLPVPQRLRDSISKLGISLDVMDSRNAASTFNLLQEEGRTVGLALCPLRPTAKQS